MHIEKATGSKFRNIIKELLINNQSEDPELELRILNEITKEESNMSIYTDISKCILDKQPIQYYAGYTYINGDKLYISDKVLLPGPEMRYMLELCEKYIRKNNKNLKIMDLCCGSGVVSTVLGKKFSSSIFYASDISKDATEIAEKNFNLYSLENINMLVGDLFQPFYNSDILDFDFIIANPPYCKTNDIEKLPAGVRDYAPRIAIDGGNDGLEIHKRIIEEAYKLLKHNGYLILQNENGQSGQVQQLLFENGYCIVEVGKNHLNQERIIVAQLKKR